MRSYGDGVLNGSLWTITVELQFYVIVPLVYFLLRLDKGGNAKLLMLIFAFFVINRVFSYFSGSYNEHLLYKLAKVSFAPWFYMFLVGMFFQRNFEYFHKLLAGKFLYLLAIYIVIGYFASMHEADYGNNIDPLFYLLLVPLVFSSAYSNPGMAKRITRGNDFSYGIYIYHMPIVNFLIYLGFSGSVFWSFVALLITVAVAMLSWFYIEKPCLKLKHHPFNPMSKGQVVGKP
jgi:peptidoglycan/LPS O-acetylase OafA/YrhL